MVSAIESVNFNKKGPSGPFLLSGRILLFTHEALEPYVGADFERKLDDGKSRVGAVHGGQLSGSAERRKQLHLCLVGQPTISSDARHCAAAPDQIAQVSGILMLRTRVILVIYG